MRCDSADDRGAEEKSNGSPYRDLISRSPPLDAKNQDQRKSPVRIAGVARDEISRQTPIGVGTIRATAFRNRAR